MVTVAAGGLSVSAGSATIRTTSTGPGSASALVLDATDSLYANNAAVLSVSTATAGGSAFFLFKVRGAGQRCVCAVLVKRRWGRGALV